mmetsp:Transcript_12413/g.14198  ORF Transcript_12413/g.14198 Transcript_12413/m.14198 type:complete len:126 (+) Transcript_12413:14-391(+)
MDYLYFENVLLLVEFQQDYQSLSLLGRAKTRCSLVIVELIISGNSGSGTLSLHLAKSSKSPLFTKRYGGGPVWKYSQMRCATPSGISTPVDNLLIHEPRYDCIVSMKFILIFPGLSSTSQLPYLS